MTIKSFTPIRDKVFVTDLEHGLHQTKGGIILPEDNMKLEGIRDRWAKVYKIGPDVDGIAPGNWVLLKHGRWTNKIKIEEYGETFYVWRVEYPDAILLVTDTDPRTRTEIAAPSLSGYTSGN